MPPSQMNVALMSLLLVFLLGAVCGMRTFTAPAVLLLVRHRGLWAYVLAAAALFEYYFDVNPNTPARTNRFGISVRLVSGAFVGWWSAHATGLTPLTCAVVGAVGAFVGAHVTLAIRMRAIAIMGNVASGLLEDLVTIAAAVAIVVRL